MIQHQPQGKHSTAGAGLTSGLRNTLVIQDSVTWNELAKERKALGGSRGLDSSLRH